MRAGLDESVQLMEQREMNTNIEYAVPFPSPLTRDHTQDANSSPRFEQLTLRANTLREELHTEIEKILNDVIKFKEHIQQNLENYESIVDQEVKDELDNGDAEEKALAGAAVVDE